MFALASQRPKRTTPATPLALLACLALGLAGCTAAGPSPDVAPSPGGGPTAGPLTSFTPAPAAVQSKVDCFANADWLLHGEAPTAAVTELMGSVPTDFTPVDVVECQGTSLVLASSPATPSAPTIQEQHFSGAFTPLLTALAVQSDKQTGIACEAMLQVTPDLWLVNDSGKAVHVEWPRTACGFSKPGVQKALDGLMVASTTTLIVPTAP